MDEQKEHARDASQQGEGHSENAGSAEVEGFSLMEAQVKMKPFEKDLTLRVRLKNGPELRRLVDVMIDVSTVVDLNIPEVKKQKAMRDLREALKDMTWFKSLIVID